MYGLNIMCGSAIIYMYMLIYILQESTGWLFPWLKFECPTSYLVLKMVSVGFSTAERTYPSIKLLPEINIITYKLTFINSIESQWIKRISKGNLKKYRLWTWQGLKNVLILHSRFGGNTPGTARRTMTFCHKTEQRKKLFWEYKGYKLSRTIPNNL